MDRDSTPALTPEPAPQSERKVSAFQESLNTLEGMGFSDRAVNIATLVKHNGDILKAITALCG
jgi:hypothetical protein